MPKRENVERWHIAGNYVMANMDNVVDVRLTKDMATGKVLLILRDEGSEVLNIDISESDWAQAQFDDLDPRNPSTMYSVKGIEQGPLAYF